MKIAINGISGRMGRTIYKILLQRGHTIAGGYEIESSPFIGKDTGDLLFAEKSGVLITTFDKADFANVDAIIDFSAPSGTLKLLKIAAEKNVPLVIGTTGIDDSGTEQIRNASKVIPIVYSSNMSTGVNILFKLTEYAAKCIPDGYDVEVMEAHHKMKKDSPSGTAKTLLSIIKKSMARIKNLKDEYRGEGILGERKNDELGVQVIRGGDIVGEHTVFFIGNGERIEITHRATSRDIFADGSVRAAEFLNGKPAGLYDTYSVLGL